jgi:predicted amidohydrolase
MAQDATSRTMRLALAQIDVRLGDLEANSRRVREVLAEARAGGADLVVFPELALSGYALGQVAAESAREPAAAIAVTSPEDPAALIGFAELEGGRRHNSAVYVERGESVHVQRKLYLPDYPPFEEGALFTAGGELRAFDAAFGRLAVLICNDAWQPVLPFIAIQDGAQVLLMPSNSSTAVPEAEHYWRELTRFYARMLQCYVVFVNRVGSEAGFTYWGGSHVVDPLGELVVEAPRLEEAIAFADVDLDRVEKRRRELPLVGEPRLDFLRAQLERLARERSEA